MYKSVGSESWLRVLVTLLDSFLTIFVSVEAAIYEVACAPGRGEV